MLYIFDSIITMSEDKDGNITQAETKYYQVNIRKNSGYIIKLKKWQPKKGKDTPYRLGLMCQMIAEGGTLSNICKKEWALHKIEFFVLLDENIEYASWYATATKYRNQILVDTLYSRISEINIQEKGGADKFRSVLRDLNVSIKRAAGEDDGSRVILHRTVWEPEIQGKIRKE